MSLLDDRRTDDIHLPVPDGPLRRGWFAGLARLSVNHRRAVMLIWLGVVLAAAPLALTLSGALSGAGWEAQGSTAQVVRDELRCDFPTLGAEAAVVVYRQDAPISASPDGLAAVVASLDGAPVRRPSSTRSRPRRSRGSSRPTAARPWCRLGCGLTRTPTDPSPPVT